MKERRADIGKKGSVEKKRGGLMTKDEAIGIWGEKKKRGRGGRGGLIREGTSEKGNLLVKTQKGGTGTRSGWRSFGAVGARGKTLGGGKKINQKKGWRYKEHKEKKDRESQLHE